MLLTPHHLQQWDIYHEHIVNARLSSLHHYGWGLKEIEIDNEGIVNGNFTLLKCRGIFKSGFVIDIPNLDKPPLQKRFDLSPSMDYMDVFIAVPVERANSANCLLNGMVTSHETRYIQENITVPDYNTGQNEREIAVAKKNLKILLQNELSDEYDVLRLARISRTSVGTVGLNPEFIPTCLSISCSHRLISLIRGILEILTSKSSELSSMCRQRTSDVYDFGPTDNFNLWLLQTINSFIPILLHFYRSQTAHPEAVYYALVQLVGQLSTVAVRIRPEDVPEYRHDDLTYTFTALDMMIRNLITMVSAPSVKYRMVPLQKVSDTNFMGRIDDATLFLPQIKFFLGIKADVSQEKIIDELPRKAKVGSVETIELLTRSALPGITLFYSALPPASIPRKSGYLYFALDNRGPYWDNIRKSSSIAVFIPMEFLRAEVELIAVEE